MVRHIYHSADLAYYRAIITSFPAISALGGSLEIRNRKEFRDVGIMLWPHAFCYMLRIPDHASLYGFGYMYFLPTQAREKKGKVGSLAMLRDLNYLVRDLIHLFYSCLIFTDKIHARQLHVPEMDLMSSSALETKGLTI